MRRILRRMRIQNNEPPNWKYPTNEQKIEHLERLKHLTLHQTEITCWNYDLDEFLRKRDPIAVFRSLKQLTRSDFLETTKQHMIVEKAKYDAK